MIIEQFLYAVIFAWMENFPEIPYSSQNGLTSSFSANDPEKSDAGLQERRRLYYSGSGEVRCNEYRSMQRFAASRIKSETYIWISVLGYYGWLGGLRQLHGVQAFSDLKFK